MSKLTASYIAGFVDGEGYIGILRRKKNNFYRAVLKVANTNKEIIYWLKNSFGGTIWIRTPKLEENRKIAYCWTLEGNNLIPLIKKISPYLKVKKRQAEIIKKFKKTVTEESYHYPEREAKNGGKFVSRTMNKDVMDYRVSLYNEIRELNKVGKLLHCERLNKETPIMKEMR